MKKIFGIVFILLSVAGIALGISLGTSKTSRHKESVPLYKYVLTNTHKPDSFDPLDADNFNNLHTARMIYLAPLEVSGHTGNDEVTSQLLEKYGYNKNTHTLSFVVKNGLVYSDDSPVTAEDVAFAILRMAYTRPGFPVIKHIKGLEEWHKSANPLQNYPEGIRVSGNKIEIVFDWDVPNPLYRFCLELFSVIPKRCVDLNTNKIICDEIPTNGRYSISHKADRAWTFVKNDRFNFFEGPEKIIFEFWEKEKNILEKIKTIDENTVVHSNDAVISPKQKEGLMPDFKIYDMAASRFSSILMNPETKSFRLPECRRTFAMAIINTYADVNETLAEGSLFPVIIPGHIGIYELGQNFKTTPQEDLAKCGDTFKKNPPRLGIIGQTELKIGRHQLVERAYSSLGLERPEINTFKGFAELDDAFLKKEIDFIFFNSGFWPMDAAGDLQMLFTPNLHKPLYFVSKDKKFQGMIEEIVKNPNDEKLYRQLNQYLYNHALMRAYAYSQRFYLSKNHDFLNGLPLGVTSPAPWQLFR